MINTNEEKIKEILSRGVEEFIDPKKDGQMTFEEKLIAKANDSYNKEIIIKFGIDPTRPDIHLGHAVILRTLRKLQNIGCKVVFLIGDFTAQIGDPTGKNKIRPELHRKEIQGNMKTYLDQVDKILLTDDRYFSWIINSDWFMGIADIKPEENSPLLVRSGLSFASANTFVGKAILYQNTRMQFNELKKSQILGVTLITLMSTLRRITHSQLLARDMFQERIKKGDELYMHEMLYPVLQGIDSYAINEIYASCDLEIGGTDQTFNMLMGRDVMRINKQIEQAVVSMKILRGTDGKNKMSKSLDNYISIIDTAEDMFGKIMSLPDELIKEYLELCTDLSNIEIGKIMNMPNPRDQKAVLAKEIVKLYQGEKAAEDAEEQFNQVFRNKELPSDIEIFETDKKNYPILELLCDMGLASSKKEAQRLIEAGGIVIIQEGQETKISDWKKEIVVEDEMIVKRGSRQFKKIMLK